MGRGMAGRLIGAGHDVTVWNRTAERCAPLVEQGAVQADTPAEAAQGAEIVMWCLSKDSAVEELLFGRYGLADALTEGQIAVDMSTLHPDTTLKTAAALNEKGVRFLDAPVFGTKGEARDGGLWIVVGGDKVLYEEMLPILNPLSETTHYMGENGKGTAMKLVGNLLVSMQIEAIGEAMILATKAGLNPREALDVINVTDFKSPIFAGVGGSLIERDFDTSFALKWMYKDANLIAKFAEDLKAPIPGASAARETIKAAVNQGWGEENASALIKALEMAAGVEVKA